MGEIKTFDASGTSIISDTGMDPILRKQKEDVCKMRTALLSASADPRLTSNAIKQVTVLQVYHQLTRIIRYTELIDKLEEKLYSSIEYTIDTMDETSMLTWRTLISIQERLQKLIIESNKVFAPFLDMNAYVESVSSADNEVVPSKTIGLDASKREKLRASARHVLEELNVG